MPKATLVDTVVDQLLERIIDGRYQPGEALESEAVIGESFDVSRLTVREALKALRAMNVVEARRGSGTYVRPAAEWTSLQAVMQLTTKRPAQGINPSVQLLEVRRMIEVGAAELAAERADEDVLKGLSDCLEQMRSASGAGDVEAFTAADIQFHDIILQASGNVIVLVLFEPLHRLLQEKRRETSAVPEIQRHAIEHHRALLAALRDRDPLAARVAMLAHMDQTLQDLKHYVLRERTINGQ
ncbi:FadR family transcriptional regulator [Acaricomes phytoseiuli]|uniref:FadR/GntR family transcriptional regulator n=1 Tax=Acaricomes phytoseiuli TaxID=291968 RepID=UPI0003785FE1|nr:FadR/GntR family transcriptional regulator [Acaricomes phytoseiuli]MCW1248944.1 FadR family transcriptional regulator [Acaricomes phytoseiuli]